MSHPNARQNNFKNNSPTQRIRKTSPSAVCCLKFLRNNHSLEFFLCEIAVHGSPMEPIFRGLGRHLPLLISFWGGFLIFSRNQIPNANKTFPKVSFLPSQLFVLGDMFRQASSAYFATKNKILQVSSPPCFCMQTPWKP